MPRVKKSAQSRSKEEKEKTAGMNKTRNFRSIRRLPAGENHSRKTDSMSGREMRKEAKWWCFCFLVLVWGGWGVWGWVLVGGMVLWVCVWFFRCWGEGGERQEGEVGVLFDGGGRGWGSEIWGRGKLARALHSRAENKKKKKKKRKKKKKATQGRWVYDNWSPAAALDLCEEGGLRGGRTHLLCYSQEGGPHMQRIKRLIGAQLEEKNPSGENDEGIKKVLTTQAAEGKKK